MVTIVNIIKLFQVAHETCADVNEYQHQEQNKKESFGKECTSKIVALVDQWKRTLGVEGLKWKVHPFTTKK
jgi:hypothetical protein